MSKNNIVDYVEAGASEIIIKEPVNLNDIALARIINNNIYIDAKVARNFGLNIVITNGNTSF